MAEGALCLPPSIQLTFRSTKVEKATSMPFAPQGDLTIHGVTRNVESRRRQHFARRSDGGLGEHRRSRMMTK